MPWLFAIGAALIAAIAETNIFAWGVMGFIAGYVLNLASRTANLERQLKILQAELAWAKKQNSAAIPAAEPEKQAEFHQTTSESAPPEPPDAEEDPSPPLVFPRKAEPQKDAWTSEPVYQQQAKPPETETPLPYSEREITPSKPSDLDKLAAFIWNWFTDGNTFVRVGIVILFIGVSFLLNLAINRGYIPIELRLSAVAAAAIALLTLGWRLRETRADYALLIQGGAVGLLYLTIFASYNLYHVLPSGLAFFLLVLIVGLSAALAVLENAVSLALFGSIGGFLAPILTSSGTNNYIGLFSFYAVLNAGIFAIAWFKAWRILNLVGFTFTFSIGAFWGASNYQPENFASVEPFLILFFLFYVAISMLYASRRAPDFKDYIDGTLNFGTPILAFGLQSAMVKNYEYGIAISAFVLGLFYLTLAKLVWQRFGNSLKFLSEVQLAVCVIFVTLAIPFAVDDSTTSATWAVESAGVLWVSIRQQHYVRRLFALGLQACAGIALLSDATSTHGVAFLNSAFIGVVILSLCGGLSSWMLSWHFPTERPLEKSLAPFLLAYSLLWLFLGFDYQIEHHDLRPQQNDLMLSLTVVMTAVLMQLGKQLNWKDAKYGSLSMMIPLVLGAFVTLGINSHPSAGHGMILWPLNFALYFWSLKNSSFLNSKIYLNLHIFSGVFLATLLFWEGFWQLLLVGSLLSLLFNELSKRWQWPQLRVLALGLFSLMLFLTFASLFTHTLHPFELPDIKMGLTWAFEAGYLLWPLAFAVLYSLFSDDENHVSARQSPVAFRGLSLLLLVILSTWESSWHLTSYFAIDNGWHIALFPLFAVAALWSVMLANFYPFNRYQQDYLAWTINPLIAGLIVWSILSLKSPANSEPLPWLPLLNPSELIQAMVLVTLIRFIFLQPTQRINPPDKRDCYVWIARFTFVWLNFMLLRAIHHWGGLAWSGNLWSEPLTQTCLSIFWTLTGLSLTIVATQKQVRKLWLTGATLLTIVVAKLFLFDLHSHDSMERIISFITVGGLLMLIGYFAPLPPKVQKPEEIE